MKRGLNFSGPKCKGKPTYDKTYLLFFRESFVVRFSLLMTSFQSVFWSCLYFLLTLLFAIYSPFYLCFPSFSFAFLSSCSAYFSALSNFPARFSRLDVQLLLLAFFGRSFSFSLDYFHSKPFPHELGL